MPGELVTGWRDRVFFDLVAIACWIALWFASVMIGLELGQKVIGREGRDGYLALVGLGGVLLVSPLALLCSTFFLWVQRNVVIFICCGAAVGLGITLLPLLGG
jgi:hypothetical protein